MPRMPEIGATIGDIFFALTSIPVCRNAPRSSLKSSRNRTSPITGKTMLGRTTSMESGECETGATGGSGPHSGWSCPLGESSTNSTAIANIASAITTNVYGWNLPDVSSVLITSPCGPR